MVSFLNSAIAWLALVGLAWAFLQFSRAVYAKVVKSLRAEIQKKIADEIADAKKIAAEFKSENTALRSRLRTDGASRERELNRLMRANLGLKKAFTAKINAELEAQAQDRLVIDNKQLRREVESLRVELSKAIEEKE